MTIKSTRGVVLTTSVLLLAACGTPFSDKLSAIDWSGHPAAGTIAVSAPKMYRRASLINERRLDAEWLDQQIDESRAIEFKPEIAREVEQITAFAAALGLSFDPASALNYKRTSETGDLQQQIQVMKLQLQLDQLKRDAELVRDKFASQTDPVNKDLGIANAGAPASAVSTASASADQLRAAVDRLTTTLATRLDADAKGLMTATTHTNPADVFRDRLAYRDLLKASRNAASLDDSHDLGGNALIRLNFQALVLPDRRNLRSPGVVQMTIKPADIDPQNLERIYKGWLEHINGRLNVATDNGWEPNNDILNSAAIDNFELWEYRYDRSGTPAPAPTIQESGTKRASPAAGSRTVAGTAPRNPPAPAVPAAAPLKCPGFAVAKEEVDERCGTLYFAVPRFQGSSIQQGAYSTLENYLDWFYLEKPEKEDIEQAVEMHRLVVSTARQLAPQCGLPSAQPPRPGEGPSDAYRLDDALRRAQIRLVAGEAILKIERAAQRTLKLREGKAASADALPQGIATRTERARRFLSTFEQAAYKGCLTKDVRAFRDSFPKFYVPLGFSEALRDDRRIAVYEVGPREQVQQVSTVSRVANNLSLAVSLAAAAPTSGAAANAAANYSRQAIGKAAALERVPALLGYSVGNNTFGWVIAPKATVDPKGSLDLEQSPRTLDLSVDLSVPSWWPSLTIETVTGWASDAASITKGTIAMNGQQASSVSIPMGAVYADYQAITARITLEGRNDNRPASLLDDPQFRGQAVSACNETNLYIWGPDIWRATVVFIGGYRLGESAITVAPDMSGILLKVPPLGDLLGDVGRAKLPVSVFTRYGEAAGKVDYIPKPVPGGCKPAEKKANADTPLITSVMPAQFRAGADVWFAVEGTKLDQFNRVTINGQPGEVVPEKGGKSLKAKFTAAQTASLPVSRTIALSFFKDSEKLGERLVEVTEGVK